MPNDIRECVVWGALHAWWCWINEVLLLSKYNNIGTLMSRRPLRSDSSLSLKTWYHMQSVLSTDILVFCFFCLSLPSNWITRNSMNLCWFIFLYLSTMSKLRISSLLLTSQFNLIRDKEKIDNDPQNLGKTVSWIPSVRKNTLNLYFKALLHSLYKSSFIYFSPCKKHEGSCCWKGDKLYDHDLYLLASQGGKGRFCLELEDKRRPYGYI